MRALHGVLLATTLGAVTLGAGGSPHPSRRPFLGLWEGVDVNDGSKRTVSITDRDGDGELEVDSRDSYWTLCDGARGLERATGRVRRDGVLETSGVVSCFESGDQVVVMQTYELSRREGTLFADPHVSALVPITLHRVSE